MRWGGRVESVRPSSENKVVHGDDFLGTLEGRAAGDHVPTTRHGETSGAYADDFPADVAEGLVLGGVCGVVLVRVSLSSWGVVLDGDAGGGDEQVWEDVEGTPRGGPHPHGVCLFGGRDGQLDHEHGSHGVFRA